MVRNVSVFDDELSRDHDFAPRFCLWLTDEDYDAIGEQLQADYDALSRDFTVAEQGKPHFAGHGSLIPTLLPHLNRHLRRVRKASSAVMACFVSAIFSSGSRCFVRLRRRTMLHLG